MSEVIKVDFDEVDFIESEYGYELAFYKGVLFSGIVFEYHKDNYFEYEYLQGVENGKSYGANKFTNEIVLDENFINGKRHGYSFERNELKKYSSKAYYDNGSLISEKCYTFDNVLIKYFDLDKKVDEEYYENGSVFSVKKYIQFEYERNEYYYFPDDMKPFLWKDNDVFQCDFDKVYQNSAILDSKYHYFLTGHIVSSMSKINNRKTCEFLLQLLEHKDPYMRGEAAYFLGELGDLNSIKFLRKLINDKNNPCIDARFGGGSTGNMYTVGERAKRSIKKLKGPNIIAYYFNLLFGM